MYAYVGLAGQREEYWNQYGENIAEDKKVSKPREIAYWRKHPNLHGWMEQLWLRKQDIPVNDQDQFVEDRHPPQEFNRVELELTPEDLDNLELAITHKQLPNTAGFLFGIDADDHYRERDLEFIKNARADMFFGLKVFYNSSW